MSKKKLTKVLEDDKAAIKDALMKISAHLNKIEEREMVYDGAYIEQIRDIQQSFLDEPHHFERGDIVRWKKMLKNKRLPHKNQPAVVVEVLDNPIHDDFNSATPYFREPLDIALGMIDEDDEFMVFHYDSRRFELYRK